MYLGRNRWNLNEGVGGLRKGRRENQRVPFTELVSGEDNEGTIPPGASENCVDSPFRTVFPNNGRVVLFTHYTSVEGCI